MSKHCMALLAAFICGLVAGCAAFDPGDQVLANRVEAALVQAGIYGTTGIRAKADHRGGVALHGYVHSHYEADRAAAIVLTVPGVTAVRNLIDAADQDPGHYTS